jgi:hypothetical protein
MGWSESRSPEGPRGKWVHAGRTGKRDLNEDVLEKQVLHVKKQGFVAREILPCFWPKHVYEAHFGKALHPQELGGARTCVEHRASPESKFEGGSESLSES